MQLTDDKTVMSVINCHAPSAGKSNLTAEIRVPYFREFHKVSGEDKLIWGGDFGISEFKAAAMLEMEPHKRYVDQNNATCSAERPTMNVVHSRLCGGLERDKALTYNLHTQQADSNVGKVMAGSVSMVIW